jgi:flagellar export protein FliJ
MLPYKFRLATLLRLREAHRDEMRVRLAEAQQADQIVANQLARIEADLRQLDERTQRDLQPGQVDVDRLMESQRYELILNAERHATSEQRKIVSKEVERRRNALISADREVRVLEKLRERQFERHREEEQREETKALDEVGIQGTWKKEH